MNLKLPRARILTAALLAASALAAAACGGATGGGTAARGAVVVPAAGDLAKALRKLEQEVAVEESRGKKLFARVTRFSPAGTYIVVDTGTNHLYLMQGEKIMRDAPCSTGSGSRLVDIAGRRVWIFNTPRGEFEVLRKIVDPVWTKPDWAFIEDGEPIPKNFADRRDPDVLGRYALQLPDGYLIHGSIYKRTIGMSVTHGCVRLGDEDLEAVFKAAQIGTKVYII